MNQSHANPIGQHNFYGPSEVKYPPVASPASRQEPSFKDFSVGSHLGPSNPLSERTLEDTDSLHSEAGSYFNENALAGLKTPFSITCLTECHFATLSYHDYHRCLARIEAKLLTKTLYFLQELPFFKAWSKTMLSKVVLSFKAAKFFRG